MVLDDVRRDDGGQKAADRGIGDRAFILRRVLKNGAGARPDHVGNGQGDRSRDDEHDHIQQHRTQADSPQQGTVPDIGNAAEHGADHDGDDHQLDQVQIDVTHDLGADTELRQ